GRAAESHRRSVGCLRRGTWSLPPCGLSCAACGLQNQYLLVMGKISASTAQASWYSTTATVGSDAMPPASDMITAITQLISTDAVSTTPARYSPSAAPAAASRPPTKLAKLP